MCYWVWGGLGVLGWWIGCHLGGVLEVFLGVEVAVGLDGRMFFLFVLELY